MFKVGQKVQLQAPKWINSKLYATASIGTVLANEPGTTIFHVSFAEGATVWLHQNWLSPAASEYKPCDPTKHFEALGKEFGPRIDSPLPEDSVARKEIPLVSGCLDYFPAALAAVAAHSKRGNDKHNPGLPMQDNRTKSNDDIDCIGRHLIERDLEALAWRALRALQKDLESKGAPIAPAATFK